MCGIGQAEVLDAVRQAARVRAERFVNAKHLVNRDVADCVSGDAPARRVRLAAQRGELVMVEAQHALLRRVPVADAQGGRRAAEPPIGEELGGVDAKPVRDELFRQRQRRGHVQRAGEAPREDRDPAALTFRSDATSAAD